MRLTLAMLAMIAATPAFAQTATTPPAEAAADPHQAAIQTTAMGWAQCLQAGVAGAPATGTAQEAAGAVMANCATQQTALQTAIDAAIAARPAAEQAAAREQARTQLASVQPQIAAGIEQARAGRAAAPAAPAPSQPQG